MSIFAEQTEQAAVWAVVTTLATILVAFITSARRDRRKAEVEAVSQWKELATNAIAARDAAFIERDRAITQANDYHLKVVELEGNLRYLRGEHK